MPRTTSLKKETSPILRLDWSMPSKSCETSPSMTNDLLLNNIHLIRFAVDGWLDSDARLNYSKQVEYEMKEFQAELERTVDEQLPKHKATGDCP